MALFKKRKRDEDFKTVQPVAIEPNPAEAPENYGEPYEQQVEQFPEAEPEPVEQIQEETYQNPPPTPRFRRQRAIPKPVTKYVEVPINLDDDNLQRMMNWENNRMLKEILTLLKEE